MDGPDSFISAVSARILRPRPWLSPLAPLYWALSRLHRAGMRAAAAGSAPAIPLVVVGALRAGGSGKTSVTLELARILAARGCRPAILAYRMGPGSGRSRDPVLEVRAGDDWRRTSEEAVMLRLDSGCRVFATRDRAAAWRRLHDADIQGRAPFDILLSDDGFQDPRLAGALRLLLIAPGERPGLFDLLPAGPFRETWAAAARADLILEGPYPRDEVTSLLPMGGFPAPVRRFGRDLLLPPGLDPGRPWIAYCALGDNRPFLRGLARAGIRPAAVVEGRNHAAPPLKILQACAARHPGAGIVCTRKDWLKLGPARAAGLPLFPVGQSVSLDPETVAAVEIHRSAGPR
ncbi:MAG TPA: tetraacyldisaccharide 4'-kinase [Fibrobacteria bacterium]|nr:tetraacyldisaccharide 4'-kinase [Fibrobacteria bacterium]